MKERFAASQEDEEVPATVRKTQYVRGIRLGTGKVNLLDFCAYTG